MNLKILHLYYDIMNLYGEYGNIKILISRLKDLNIEVDLEQKTIGDNFNLNDYDFIYIGAGTEKNQLVVLDDFKKHKEELKQYINNEKYILMTGNSFEMIGKSINNKQALGILEFEVENLKDRKTSDVIFKSKYFSNKIVGFINKMSNITNNQNPLFEVEFGIGENENNDYEGIKYKNLYGTYVIGPILIRNPEILKKLIEGICYKKDSNFKLTEKEYLNEEEGYRMVLSELEKRKNK